MDDRTELTEAEIAASRVRAFLIEREAMRGLDAEHITAANWAALTVSDLLAVLDSAARVSDLSRDLAAQNTRIEEYAAQIDRMNATIALLTLHNAFEGAAQITSAALSVSDPGQDKENNR